MNQKTKKTKSTEPITVAILGLGRAGWDIHIAQLKDDPRFRLIEVADADPQRRAEAVEKLGVTAYASRDEMLKKGHAELVVVATPTPFHEEDALAVCRARRHCILEKPLGLTYRGCRKVVESFAKAGLRLFVHHQHPLGDEHVFLRRLLKSKLLGEVFEIRFNWANYARRNDWQTLLKNGGGIWANHGTHALSSMLELLDAPVVELVGSRKHVKDAGDADDHSHFLLRAANGRLGDLFLTTCCAADLPRFIVLGSAGTATAMGRDKVCLKFYNPATAPKIKVCEGAAPGRAYGFPDALEWKEEIRDLKPTEKNPSFQDGVAATLRGKASPAITAESALEVMRVLEWAATGKNPVSAKKTPPKTKPRAPRTSKNNLGAD
jgi:predicted dehydrogenase